MRPEPVEQMRAESQQMRPEPVERLDQAEPTTKHYRQSDIQEEVAAGAAASA
jgi:hypothetical protein